MCGALRVSRTLNSGLRASGLLVVAALTLHWGRYLFTYGPSAESELHRQGHGYLVEFVPVILVAALALAIGAFAVRLAWLGPGGPGRGRIWVAVTYAVFLLVIFAAQELAELLVTDQRSAWQAVMSEGGWISVPLAACLGYLLALADKRLAKAESLVALWLRAPSEHRSRAVARGSFASTFSWIPAQGQLAFGWARRPPPPPA